MGGKTKDELTKELVSLVTKEIELKQEIIKDLATMLSRDTKKNIDKQAKITKLDEAEKAREKAEDDLTAFLKNYLKTLQPIKSKAKTKAEEEVLNLIEQHAREIEDIAEKIEDAQANLLKKNELKAEIKELKEAGKKRSQKGEKTGKYLTAFNSTSINTFATVKHKDIKKDPYLTDDDGFKAFKKGVEAVFKQYDQQVKNVGIDDHQLLSVAIHFFSILNGLNAGKGEYKTAVRFPLKDYASLRGYKVNEEPKETEEEREKERKRAENALIEAHKKVKKSLNFIQCITLNNKKADGKRSRNFIQASLVSSSGIKKGEIYINFTNEFAEHLLKNPLTQYPSSILQIDERNHIAYEIGYKMATHYSITSNQDQLTHEKLKVDTLLQACNLPTIESVRRDNLSWKHRIKIPFEKALNLLLELEVIESWQYIEGVGKNSKLFTDEINDYNTFENLYVKFKMANHPYDQLKDNVKLTDHITIDI